MKNAGQKISKFFLGWGWVGGPQNLITVFENFVVRPVFHR